MSGDGKSSGKGHSGRGRNDLKVRVKTARGRKLSSTRWLQRQLNDPYVRAAKADGYRSRAAYKLIEIDKKFNILKPGMRVVDLGAAPGGWLQVVVERCNVDGSRKNQPQGRLIGVDLQEVEAVTGAELLLLDFMDEGADDIVKAHLVGPADIVLSDMAASSIGHRQTDHLRIIALCEAAAYFAFDVLDEGGAFVAKVLRGGTENQLLKLLQKHFRSVKHFKPAASRSDSAEMYVIATGFARNDG